MNIDAVKRLNIFTKHLIDQEDALDKDPEGEDFLPNHEENCKILENLIKKVEESE